MARPQGTRAGAERLELKGRNQWLGQPMLQSLPFSVRRGVGDCIASGWRRNQQVPLQGTQALPVSRNQALPKKFLPPWARSPTCPFLEGTAKSPRVPLRHTAPPMPGLDVTPRGTPHSSTLTPHDLSTVSMSFGQEPIVNTAACKHCPLS